MVRLPNPGSDEGVWGSLLNEFLNVAHNPNGTIKASVLASKADVSALDAKADVTDLDTKADKTVTISAGTGLTGGGNLSANRVLSVQYGTSATTAAVGNDARITGAAQKTTLDFINLLDYVPDGPNGTTDNAADIRQAIIDAGTGVKRLFIPQQADPWIIGTQVLIDVDIEIFSNSWGNTSATPCIQLAPGLDDYGFVFSTTRVDGNRVTFTDIEIDGNASQQAAGGIIQANNPVQCIFERVHLHHAYDTALWLHGQQGTGPYGHHNRIVNCLFDNSAGSAGYGRALVMQSADENMVINCDFENNGNVGAGEPYHIKDWSGINAIVNCVFVGGGEAVRFQDASGSRVVGCMFDGVGRTAVHVSGSNMQVSANHFSGLNTASPNTYFHLILDNGGHCAVTGNVFDSGTVDQALRGLVAQQPSSTHNVVTGNVFRVNTGDLGDGGIYDWNGSSAVGTSTTVKTNSGLADQ